MARFFFSKNKLKKLCDEGQVFTLQVDKRCQLSNACMVLFPFKGEKDGLPRYKPHWNFIESNTNMLVKRAFGMLKGKFQKFIQKNKYSLHQMLNLVKICKCALPIQMVFI